MCKFVRLVHNRKSKLDLRNKDVAHRMSSYLQETINPDMPQKVFAGSQGLMLDNMGAFLDALHLKAVDKGCMAVDVEEYKSLLKAQEENARIKRRAMESNVDLSALTE